MPAREDRNVSHGVPTVLFLCVHNAGRVRDLLASLDVPAR